MVRQGVGSPGAQEEWSSLSRNSRADVERPAWLKVGAGRGQAAVLCPGGPETVLFVCTGNICRSAFACAYLSHLLKGSETVVESAGIGALVGHGMDERAQLVARQLGVDGSAHRARQLTGRMLGEASMVVVFGPEHYDWIQENNPEAIAKTVAIGQFASGVEQAADGQARVRSVSGLLSAVKQTQPVPDDSSWIRDPYKRDDSEYIQIMREVIETVDRLREKVKW